MEKLRSVIDSVTNHWVAPHPDGHKFIAIAAVITILVLGVCAELAWIPLILTAYVAYFFRDPNRICPQQEGLILSPADGRVSAIEVVPPPKELANDLTASEYLRVSVFLSIFDVHVNRVPVSGKIHSQVYTKGKFLNAELDKASEDNERNALTIDDAHGRRIGVVQIAGLIARRILTFVDTEQTMKAGERFGLIRFGSRLDVYLPVGTRALVTVNQKAIAGETVLADMNLPASDSAVYEEL